MAEFTWTVGFINEGQKYLSAEKFQFKVNASGNSLRKKQVWTLEKIDDQVVAIKSCFNRYLGCDKNGTITADADEIGDDNKFELISEEDGRVGIKSSKHNRYLSGSFDDLRGADGKVLWTMQLAMSPQINLRNVNRKTYAHLSAEGDEIHVNEQIPWGYDATITLEFSAGKYSIRAANAKYLSRTGELSNDVSEDARFTLVFRGGEVAFRDCKGKYLTCIGPQAVMQSRKNTISKDELFTLEDTNPQVTLNGNNTKYASIKLEEVRANQTEVTDTEIFQLEAVDRTDFSGNVKWAIRSKNKKYWRPHGAAQVIHNNADDKKDPDCHFSIEWLQSKVAFKANNGKYLGITTNGRLAASSSECTDECKFTFEIVNHPIITLRSEFGFIGAKGAASTLECNRSQYDIFLLECKEGIYSFKTVGGKYWCMEGDNFALKGGSPLPVNIELRGHTRLCIVAPNGQYTKCAQNGAFTATGGNTVSANTLLEY